LEIFKKILIEDSFGDLPEPEMAKEGLNSLISVQVYDLTSNREALLKGQAQYG
jgi:hypothetical protein